MLLAGCGKGEVAEVARATPVRIEQASQGPAVPPIDTNGMVVTKHEMRLSFKMGGLVRRIYVQQGEAVKKGQRLAEIELTEVDAQVEQARQMAEKAQRDLKRGENLYADQVISLEQLQDLRTQAAMAGLGFKTAEFNLGYSVISAPRDGVVLRKLVEERELVPAGAPVLVVGESDRGYVVRAALADREIVNVKLGDKGEIRMDAFPGQAMTGTVVEVASAAEERSGMFPIEVHFDTPPPRLVERTGGATASHSAKSPRRRSPMCRWRALVEGDGDRASVFVLDDGNAQKRDGARCLHHRRQHRARERRDARRTVITDGALFLENGEAVEVQRDATKQAANAPAGRHGG